MNLKTYGHATLSLENDEKPILITDPWLIGSCYWRSWWNYPEPNIDLISSFSVSPLIKIFSFAIFKLLEKVIV